MIGLTRVLLSREVGSRISMFRCIKVTFMTPIRLKTIIIYLMHFIINNLKVESNTTCVCKFRQCQFSSIAIAIAIVIYLLTLIFL